MKNLKKITLFTLLMYSLVLVSCKKEPEEFIVTGNLTTTGTSTSSEGEVEVTWTVQAHDGSVTGKTSGLSGAMVTIAGIDGTNKSITTDANGFATFTGLKEGIASGAVSMTGFTTVNFTADLSSPFLELSEDVKRYATTNIVVWPLTANVTAYAFGNFDNDGLASPNDTSGSDVRSGVSVRIVYTSTQPMNIPGTAGEILTSSIEPTVYKTTTAGVGSFTFSSLPANNAGMNLNADVYAGDFTLATSSVWATTFGPTDYSTSLIAGETVVAADIQLFEK